MEYGKALKETFPDTILVAGGQHATFAPEDLLENGYDAVVFGEGELTWQELLERAQAGRSFLDIKGVCYLREGQVHRNEPRDYMPDLDVLPVFSTTEFDYEPYFKVSGFKQVGIITSRGCVHKCAFCSTVGMWGRKFRCQSAERIVAEFLAIRNAGIEAVDIQDDDFALDERRVRRFCELLIEKKLMMSWRVTIGSKTLRDMTTLDLMVAAGCVSVSVSIESANERILKAYGKSFTIDDNRAIAREMRKRGIVVHNKGMIGYPDETVREIVRTSMYLLQNSDLSHVSILEPRPGSQYWEMWDKKRDIREYLRFGKGNVFFGRNRTAIYLLLRMFAAIYLLYPKRIWKALFEKNPNVRYLYAKYYEMAVSTIKVNLRDLFASGKARLAGRSRRSG